MKALGKRQRIIETAYRLFRRDGYHAVGIDRIIAEAEVAKMTMYRHFRTKDDLIVATLNFRALRFEAQLDGMMRTASTVRDRISAIVGWYERWFARSDFHGCAFAHALAEFGKPGHPVHEAASAQKDSFERRLRAILAEEFEETGSCRIALQLAIIFEGATLMAQIRGAGEAAMALRLSADAILADGGAR